MNRKSSTCFGKATGKPLTEYVTRNEAKEGAQYVAERYGKKMVPYECEECGLWHLSPRERQTQHSHWSCSCTDHEGGSKDCYRSRRDALRRAEILRREQDEEDLYVSQCPEDESIWHLTKQPYQYSGTIAAQRSDTCTGGDGQYLMAYSTEKEAEDGARYILQRYGTRLAPYECNECFMWHLGPIRNLEMRMTMMMMMSNYSDDSDDSDDRL